MSGQLAVIYGSWEGLGMGIHSVRSGEQRGQRNDSMLVDQPQ